MLLSNIGSLLCFKIWLLEEIKFFTCVRCYCLGILVLCFDSLHLSSANTHHILVELLDTIIVFLYLLSTTINYFKCPVLFFVCLKTRLRCLQ